MQNRSPVEEITEKQRETLHTIRDFLAQRGQSPTMEELPDHLGATTPNAYASVNQLVCKGYLERDAIGSANLIGSRKKRFGESGVWSAMIIWGALCLSGMVWLTQYANTPGPQGERLVSWPDDSKLFLHSRAPTLLVFIHPHCACSRATLSELEELLRMCRQPPWTQIVFFNPDGVAEGWEQTDLWQRARELSEFNVTCIALADEHSRFGATTSGQVYLFRPNGELEFQGGITGSRGHVGNNPGRSELAAILNGEPSTINGTPVFGCPFCEQTYDLTSVESCPSRP